MHSSDFVSPDPILLVCGRVYVSVPVVVSGRAAVSNFYTCVSDSRVKKPVVEERLRQMGRGPRATSRWNL